MFLMEIDGAPWFGFSLDDNVIHINLIEISGYCRKTYFDVKIFLKKNILRSLECTVTYISVIRHCELADS